MAYTNSPLVSYTRISPNRTKNRNHAIDKYFFIVNPPKIPYHINLEKLPLAFDYLAEYTDTVFLSPLKYSWRIVRIF